LWGGGNVLQKMVIIKNFMTLNKGITTMKY
jgi:hypothetical protein